MKQDSFTQLATIPASSVYNIRSRKRQFVDGTLESNNQMVGRCCVCSDDTSVFYNLLVFCDGCNVVVHKDCYGIMNISETAGWYCRRCEFKQNNDIKCEQIVIYFLFVCVNYNNFLICFKIVVL